MSKWIVTGILIGIFLGIILQFVFPDLFKMEVLFNSSLRQQTGIPQYPQYGSGSVLAVGLLTPLFVGLIGGFIGFVLFKVIKK